MLSICIPIYNFNIKALIEELNSQLRLINEPIEIVCIDDASTNRYLKYKNKITCNNLKYIELHNNIGRSKIRNLFLKYVKFNHLLFLDCDGEIINDKFIQKYIELIKTTHVKVACGGRIYDNKKPNKEKYLRWFYGHKKESKSFMVRNKNPYQSFMTNNFLIKKDVLLQIIFNEELTEYGHEDTLFGYELMRHNVIVMHIDNPVKNIDIENNATYFFKTNQAIKNLVKIIKVLKYDINFSKSVKLLSVYYFLNSKKLLFLIPFSFSFYKKLTLMLLFFPKLSLLLFDIYKLKYLKKTLQD